MTREEAITRIKDHIEIHRYHERNAVKIFEALDMALKSLEQPEIVQCKDCKHIQKWRSEESAKKFGQIYECASNVLNCPKPEDFCSHAERRTDE